MECGLETHPPRKHGSLGQGARWFVAAGLLGLLMMALLAGCRADGDGSGAAAEAQPAASEQADDSADASVDARADDSAEAGGEAASAARVVTLGGPITEIVFALGAGDRVVAVDRSSSYPEAVMQLPRLDYFRSVSVEGVLAQRPDLVIASDGTGPASALEQLEEAGVRVVRLEEVTDVAGAKKRIATIGEALGAGDRVAAVHAELDAGIARVKAAGVTAGADGPRALFLYARGQGTLMVAGRNTGAAAMIELAGGENSVEFEGFRPLSAEGVIAARPEIVVMTRKGLESLGDAEQVWAMPGLAQTPAGQAKRLVAVDDLQLLGFGPRMPLALEALGESFAKAGQAQR